MLCIFFIIFFPHLIWLTLSSVRPFYQPFPGLIFKVEQLFDQNRIGSLGTSIFKAGIFDFLIQFSYFPFPISIFFLINLDIIILS